MKWQLGVILRTPTQEQMNLDIMKIIKDFILTGYFTKDQDKIQSKPEQEPVPVKPKSVAPLVRKPSNDAVKKIKIVDYVQIIRVNYF